MKHIHPINPGSGDEAGVKPMSFDCLLGITDICTVYDKADGCGAYDYCDYDMDGGSICIKPEDGSEEQVQDSFQSFPEKVYWTRLKDVLDQAGLSATVQDTCIQVSW